MNTDSILDSLGAFWISLKGSALAFLPKLLAAAVLVIVGVLIARILRKLAARLVTNMGRIIPVGSLKKRLVPERMAPTAKVVGQTVFWISMFFFLTVATETLGLPVVSTWLGGIAGYLPKILVAILIGATGIIGGRLIHDTVAAAMSSAGLAYGNFVARMVRYGLVVVSILVAIDHLGVDVTLLTSLMLVLIAASLFAAGLSFALGSKESASNILASYYVQKVYKVGNKVRIGSTEGKIMQITPTAVLLQSAEGQVYMPAKQFNETSSLLINQEKKNES